MHDTPAVPEAPQPETGAGQPQAEAPETMPSLEALLRQAELKAEEHHDAWLRAKAETDNLRRRAQEDIAKAHKYAADKFAAEMLPVKDSLEAALATENATVENLKSQLADDPELLAALLAIGEFDAQNLNVKENKVIEMLASDPKGAATYYNSTSCPKP